MRLMHAQEWSALEPFKELRGLHTHLSWLEQILPADKRTVAIYVSGFIDIWKLPLAIKQRLQSNFCGRLKIWSKTFFCSSGFSLFLLIFMLFHFSRAA